MRRLFLIASLLAPAVAFGQVGVKGNVTVILGSGASLSDGSYTATAASGSAAYNANNGARFVFDKDVASASYLSLSSSLITGSVGFAGPSFKSSAGSGSNAFSATTNGARFDFGAGASDYASSDGTTVTFAGPLAGSNLSGTNTGDITLGAFGSAPDAKGLTLSSQILTLQPADATHPGALTIGAQTIAGQKTITGTTLIADPADASKCFQWYQPTGAPSTLATLKTCDGATVLMQYDQANGFLYTANRLYSAGGVQVSATSSVSTFHNCSAATAFDAASATLNCNCSSNITVTGAALGDQTSIGLSADMSGTNGTYSAVVTGAGTMKACFCSAGTAVDPASVNVTVCANRG